MSSIFPLKSVTGEGGRMEGSCGWKKGEGGKEREEGREEGSKRRREEEGDKERERESHHSHIQRSTDYQRPFWTKHGNDGDRRPVTNGNHEIDDCSTAKRSNH